MSKKVQLLENILGIKLSVKEYGKLYDRNQKNAYKLRNDEFEVLYLNDIEIDDISILIPHLSNLNNLYLKNCILPNFTQLLALKSMYLYFDNVTFKTKDIHIRKSFPAEIRFSNMNVDASCFECFRESSSIGVKYLQFKNCHIENLQYINYIKNLYQIVFDSITYTYQSTNTSVPSAMLMCINNTKIKDVSFIPFKESLETIQFENCEIDRIAKLTEFSKLESIEIDSDTTITDKEIIANPSQKKIKVNFTKGKKRIQPSSIVSLKNFVHLLHFENFQETTIDSLEKFDHIKTLSFDQSIFNVDAFSAVASQIENLHLRNSVIENYEHFSKFKKLIFVKSQFFEEKGNRDLQALFPLKKQLKALRITDYCPIHNFNLIEAFTELESLQINNYSDDNIQAVNSILTLQNLKKLQLSISDFIDDEEDDDENIEIHTFNLKSLENLEFLNLGSNFNFIGFEFLKKLQSLQLGDYDSEEIMNINSFPKMESLKRLNLTNYEYKIEGLAQFPNLEFLRLKGVPALALTGLKKLKVLDVTNSGVENFSEITDLPNLEKLEMSSIFTKIDVSGISKFPNLKWLTFLESYELDDISELKHLKKLEYLDLYATNVADVSVLNELPNLKQVNLLVSNSIKADLEKQIEKPEIILNCGLPNVLFTVWEEDEFGI